MAIFGPLAQIRNQISGARFAAALAYVEEILRPGSAANRRLQGIAAGSTERVELAGGSGMGIPALEGGPKPKVARRGAW